jgi:hypothetical protein
LLRSLEEETAEVIALKKSFRVEDTASDIAWIHSNEGIGGTGVAAELYDLRVFGRENRYVGLERVRKRV